MISLKDDLENNKLYVGISSIYIDYESRMKSQGQAIEGEGKKKQYIDWMDFSLCIYSMYRSFPAEYIYLDVSWGRRGLRHTREVQNERKRER